MRAHERQIVTYRYLSLRVDAGCGRGSGRSLLIVTCRYVLMQGAGAGAAACHVGGDGGGGAAAERLYR